MVEAVLDLLYAPDFHAIELILSITMIPLFTVDYLLLVQAIYVYPLSINKSSL